MAVYTDALPYVAVAMSYVDVQLMPRELLLSVIEPFPKAIKSIRRQAIFLALRRHFIDLLQQARLQTAQLQRENRYVTTACP